MYSKGNMEVGIVEDWRIYFIWGYVYAQAEQLQELECFKGWSIQQIIDYLVEIL